LQRPAVDLGALQRVLVVFRIRVICGFKEKIISKICLNASKNHILKNMCPKMMKQVLLYSS
jgi:hypothetical protein